MDKKTFAILLAVVLALLGFSTFNDEFKEVMLRASPPKTVDHVDVNLYIGAWHEQYFIPYYFERQCHNSTATYSLNHDDTIRVNNSCIRHGKRVDAIGKARPGDSTNSKLKVEFVQTFDIGAQYFNNPFDAPEAQAATWH